MARNKFDVDEKLETTFNKEHVRRLVEYIKPYKNKLILAIIVVIISSIVGLIAPYLVKVAIDDMIPEKNISGIVLLSVIITIITIFSSICLKYRIKWMTDIGQK